MIAELAYGSGRLKVELPDHADIISPAHVEGLVDEKAAFLEAVRAPVGKPALASLVPKEGTVAIAISDVTRPSPSHKLVPWILEECGLGPDRVIIVNGTGTHRANTQEELERMLGTEIARDYRVINHDAFDPKTLASVGRTSSGCEVLVNREYLEAKCKIITGFIEPHFFAGFSGGSKGVIPGVAGIDTVLHLHSAPMISHPASTWGVLDGNPVQAEVREAAALTKPDFLVNVSLNRDKQITGVFAGDVIQAHLPGCEFVRATAMQPCAHAYDVVVTTNSGYPLDQNLYQAVKGMSAAASIVKPGGAIIAAAECIDGLPEHGNFRSILSEHDDVHAMLHAIETSEETIHDQWQVQALALILKKARVYLVSKLPDELAKLAFMLPVSSVEEALKAELGRQNSGTIACLPEGPYTIPYLAE